MSDKEDLLNNLKIDRSAPPSEDPMSPQVRYGILGAISVLIVFGWLFFTGEEPVDVSTFTVKEINQNSNIQIIARNKSDQEIFNLLDEFIQDHKDQSNLKKIESLEEKLINNLDENSYSELIKLKSQLNRD